MRTLLIFLISLAPVSAILASCDKLNVGSSSNREQTHDAHEDHEDHHDHDEHYDHESHAEADGHEADAHEGEVTLSADAIARHGIAISLASLHPVTPGATAPARVSFNTEAIAHVGTPV